MIPAVQLIMALATVLWGSVAGWLKLNPPQGADAGNGVVYVLQDHPAAKTNAVTTVPTGPSAPPAPGTGTPQPTVKSITQDVVRQPWTVWGLAALGLTAPLFIAQLRAGAHEAASGARTVYDEGRSVYTRVDRADDYTENRSRARRRR